MGFNSTVHICVAVAGLDALHLTRLRVATSLFMAGSVNIVLTDQYSQKLHVLVADPLDQSGRLALALAHRTGTPAICIDGIDLPFDTGSFEVLRRGAYVREFYDCLSTTLERANLLIEENIARRLTFFECLNVNKGLILLERGLLRCLVNGAAKEAHTLRRIPFPDLARAVTSAGWRSSEVSPSAMEKEYRHDVVETFCLEELYWTAAVFSQAPVLPIAQDQVIQLHRWPVLSPGCIPTEWLLPVALLVDRPWSIGELSAHMQVNEIEISRIVAVAQLSGLLTQHHGHTRRRKSLSSTYRQILQSLAKRFGLALERVGHA